MTFVKIVFIVTLTDFVSFVKIVFIVTLTDFVS